MKRKQLTALLLSAAMVLTNTGISFAAQDVGKPGEVAAKGEKVWITLDANGGEFRFEAFEEEPGTSSTASRASRSVETSETLDIGGPAETADADGNYYLLFQNAKPVSDSAESGWNVLTKGPETAKDGMEFAGWYVDTNDLSTKLTSDSKLYGHDNVTARWVSTNQAAVEDTLKEQVQDVKVSGLEDGSTLTFAVLDETKKKDAQALTEIVSKADLSNLGVSSVELSKNDDALVQLDISVSGGTPGAPVGITMKDPFGGKYEEVLVIHLTDDAAEAQDVQYAVMDKKENTLSFTAESFSPYVLAAVDTKMAKIKVEDVKNGALEVYSQTPLGDGGSKLTVVPIGEEVEIPVGTVLHVRGQGISVDGGPACRLKDNKYQVISGGKTENISNNSVYTVTDSAVISAQFVEYIGTGLYVTPDLIEAPAVYEGEAVYYTIDADGKRVARPVNLCTDEDKTKDTDNALFTLEDGILKSKDVLQYGSYKLALESKVTEHNTSMQTITITVGEIEVEAEPNSIPREGLFEAPLKVSLLENDNWIAKDDWTVTLTSDTELFTVENDVLKSKTALSLGVYYPYVNVQIPDGRSYTKVSVGGINVGARTYFSILLGEYKRTSENHTYTTRIGKSVGNIYLESGSLFAEAEAALLSGDIKEIAMYGNHPFKGWVDWKGNDVSGDAKLEGYSSVYAIFEGYTPVTINAESDSTDNPDDETPSTPGSGDGDNSGSTSSSGGSSSSGGRGSSSAASTISGSWQRDANGWWFQLSGGGYAKNQWGKVNNVWYYFNSDGYMATGWQQINGQWYYLTEAEAGQGAMVTGWHFDTNYQRWFYLSPNGDMLTGWQQIGGKWYYLNPISDGTRGAMAANTTIDGYYVNADGAWVE